MGKGLQAAPPQAASAGAHRKKGQEKDCSEKWRRGPGTGRQGGAEGRGSAAVG